MYVPRDAYCSSPFCLRRSSSFRAASRRNADLDSSRPSNSSSISGGTYTFTRTFPMGTPSHTHHLTRVCAGTDKSWLGLPLWQADAVMVRYRRESGLGPSGLPIFTYDPRSPPRRSFVRTIKCAAYNLCGKFTPDGAAARRFAPKGVSPWRSMRKQALPGDKGPERSGESLANEFSLQLVSRSLNVATEVAA